MYSENLPNADEDSQKFVSSNKRNQVSEIWNYFEKIEWRKEKKTAKCRVAKCTHDAFSCGSEGTTRPLWRHLENKHWIVYSKTEEYDKKRKRAQIEDGSIEALLKKVSYTFCFPFSIMRLIVF